MQTLIRYRANQPKEAACSAPCAADNGPESPRGLLAGADRLYGHEKQEIERLEASLALYEREQATCVTPDIFARALAKVLPDHAGNGPFMGALVALLPEPARADFAACAQSVGELQRAVADIRDIGHEINSITNAARPVEDFLRAKLTIHKLDTATPADAVLDALQIEKVAVFNARDIHAFSARVAALTPNACA